jgi:acetyltransferase AlgX (SGNH hydrolase-like protein)
MDMPIFDANLRFYCCQSLNSIMTLFRLNTKKWKNRAINWSLFLFTSILGLLILEFAARKVVPEYSNIGQLRFETDEALFIRCEKNAKMRQRNNSGEYDVEIRTNEFGFRDKKNLLDAGLEDIIALGDSYTFGWGIKTEDRFSNLIQNDSLSVYNVAAPNDFLGYQNMLTFIQKQGIVTNKLIIGICMENDPHVYDSLFISSAQNRVPDRSLFNKFKNWLKYNSCLYSYVSIQLKSNKKLNDFLHNAGLIKHGVYPSKFDQADNTMTTSAKYLKGLTYDHKALLLIIPSRYLWSEDKERSEKENSFHKEFVEHLIENNFNVLDLKPIMEKSGNPLQYHFPVDGHWNKTGHKLAAEEITKQLHLLFND